ncbi:MAG: hypothetical protein RLZZ338_862 [Cyanobacteriota bacterium]
MNSLTITYLEFDFAKISQTIVKLDRAWFEAHQLPSTVSQPLLETWERLVDIVAELRSPSSGWPANTPQTPENLLPYLSEEALEVLEVWQNEPPPSPPLKRGELGPNPRRESGPDYIRVLDFIPQLLWYIVRSSDDVMGLLAGVKAKVSQPHQISETGTLRLVVILKGDPIPSWCIDLVTNQEATRSLLSLGSLIESSETHITKTAIPCQQLIAQIEQKIKDATPKLKEIFQSSDIQFLEPGNIWQSGKLQLKLAFEFLPDPPHETENFQFYSPEKTSEMTQNTSFLYDNNWTIESEKWLLEESGADLQISPQEDWEMSLASSSFPSTTETFSDILQEPSLLLETKVKLTNQTLLEGYFSALMKEQISRFIISQNHPNETLKTPIVGQVYDPINQLISAACELVDAIEKPEALDTLNWLGLEIFMPDLTKKLLWQIVKTNYDIMQLVGGVNAQVLSPLSDWITGTLRLMVIFQIEVSGIPMQIDVTTGQILPSDIDILPDDAIVQSQNSDMIKAPMGIESLLRQIEEKLETISPELGIWINGTEIDYHPPKNSSSQYGINYTQWESGKSKISFALQLTPH